jgi:hypothetical protein
MICSDQKIHKMLLDNEKDIKYCIHQTKLRLNRLEDELKESKKVRINFEERMNDHGK